MAIPENRLENGRFGKGMVANPGGRPKGLASYVREQTDDGQNLVDFYVSVFDGSYRIGRSAPSLRQRMEAADWLADRGHGKAVPPRSQLFYMIFPNIGRYFGSLRCVCFRHRTSACERRGSSRIHFRAACRLCCESLSSPHVQENHQR